MNKIHLKKAKKERDFLEIAGIAHVTWREHYASILSAEQIEYMLEKYQSKDAIAKAVAEGYEYYILQRMGAAVGYVAVKANEPSGKMFLSKIYLEREYRGKGYAYDVVTQLEEMCRRLKLSTIWLTVNKHNPSVGQYKKMGFDIASEQCADIGNGFVMDDYIMEKPVV